MSYIKQIFILISKKSVKETFSVSATGPFEISTPKLVKIDMLPTFNTKCKQASHFQILLLDHVHLQKIPISVCFVSTHFSGFAADAPEPGSRAANKGYQSTQHVRP